MATIAILISDLETGVEVDVRSDTEMSEDTTELTPAQAIGLATTMFIGNLIGDDDSWKIEQGEAASLELPAGVETE